jgi:hypothetical protein
LINQYIFNLYDPILISLISLISLKGKHFRDPQIKFQLLFVLAIAIGHFLDGAVLAYPSPAIPSINTTTEFDFTQMPFVSKKILTTL